jgi:hypothetical protein
LTRGELLSRAMIQERVRAGLRRAEEEGKQLGRPRQLLEEAATLPFCLVTLVGNLCANAVSQRKPND